MSNEEWVGTQTGLILLADAVEGMDLPAFVDRCERALSFGVFIDPTLFLAKHEELQRIRDLAAALIPFAKQVQQLRAEAEKVAVCQA